MVTKDGNARLLSSVCRCQQHLLQNWFKQKHILNILLKLTSQTNAKITPTLRDLVPFSNVTPAGSSLWKISTASFSGSTFLNPFSSSPLWLLVSVAAAPSQLHRSRGRWRPCSPPWPGSSSRVTPADTEASARRPLGKFGADSGPTGRRSPEPRLRPPATHRGATPRV